MASARGWSRDPRRAVIGSRSATSRRRPGRAARRERDSLGVARVPARALYGIFTQRARATFDLTGRPIHPALVRAYARIKRAAAAANARLGLLPRSWARAIVQAADRVIAGDVPDAAMLDSLHAGAGTPMHMNVNEVLANLANERLGGRRGQYRPIHPNNHVNLGQSSNDVTPTAIRLMALDLRRPLVEELRALEQAFRVQARRTARVVKPGRTHLQDAVPITYGQVFTGYAEAVRGGIQTLGRATESLRELGLGGTAVGTGITTHPRFHILAIRELSRLTGERLVPAPSPVTASWSLRPLLDCSGALRAIAVDLAKIDFDLRLLASGPSTGLGELHLPEVEPGSSIMPGKVNPSVVEAVEMACLHVVALDQGVTLAGLRGELELNVMTPLAAYELSQAFEVLTRAVRLLRTRCVQGLAVNRERVAQLVSGSLLEATALAPYLGYEVIAELVKEALAARRPFREVVAAHGLVDPRTLARLLDPRMLTSPQPIDVALRRRLQASAPWRQYRAAVIG